MMINRFNARTILLLGAAAALVACNQHQAAVNDTVNATVETNTAEVTNTAVPADGGNISNSSTVVSSAALSADYMVGKWSAMEEDCSATLEFRKDGTVTTPIGNAKWTLTGDQLAIDYGDGSNIRPSTIKAIAPDRIEITTASGRKETQKRC